MPKYTQYSTCTHCRKSVALSLSLPPSLPPFLPPYRETGPRCPVDNTKVSNHQLFKDNFAKREVLSLNVRCSANDAGCKWHGELRDLEVHCTRVRISCIHYINYGFTCMHVDVISNGIRFSFTRYSVLANLCKNVHLLLMYI